jgi:hypothetical protein
MLMVPRRRPDRKAGMSIIDPQPYDPVSTWSGKTMLISSSVLATKGLAVVQNLLRPTDRGQ